MINLLTSRLTLVSSARRGDNYVEIELPNIVDLKLYVKEHAYYEVGNKKKRVKPYCLNEQIDLWVNPELLIDIMCCLSDAKVYAGSRIQPIYFEADNGDGILLPVNHKKRVD